MIMTTTPFIEGRRITEYKGVVFGEVIAGVDFVKDFTAGLSNFFGGRSNTYEQELMQARQTALKELNDRKRGSMCGYDRFCTSARAYGIQPA